MFQLPKIESNIAIYLVKECPAPHVNDKYIYFDYSKCAIFYLMAELPSGSIVLWKEKFLNEQVATDNIQAFRDSILKYASQ